jgi:hypothetical protein
LYKSWSLGVRRGHNNDNHFYIEKKNFFSRTSMPISMKLGTNHPLVKRIKHCLKERPSSFPRGDNHIEAKMGLDHSNFFLKNHKTRRAHIYRKAF